MTKSCIITQSNYIPWKGYFDAIHKTDVFVVYDDMQYTKRDWRNRNQIKTENGLKWLSIPVEVKGKYNQKINETKISDLNWKEAHLNQLKQSYRKAACYKDVLPWVEDLYDHCNFEYLSDINLYFIKAINKFLGIETELLLSSEFKLNEERTERLVDICEEVKANAYYSSSAAKAYMDESKFTSKGISVNYWDYAGYMDYDQLHPPFTHSVSILDLIFNLGKRLKLILRSRFKRNQ